MAVAVAGWGGGSQTSSFIHLFVNLLNHCLWRSHYVPDYAGYR